MEHVKFVYISVFTHLKKKYRRYINLFRHRGYTPDTRTTNICISEEISQKLSTSMPHEQETICVDISSHAFKASRPAPLTATVPKRPSKSKAAKSDKTDSDKTPEGDANTSPLWCSEEEVQAPV